MEKVFSVLDNIVYIYIDFIESNNEDGYLYIRGIKIKNRIPMYYKEKIQIKEWKLKKQHELIEDNNHISGDRELQDFKNFLEEMPVIYHGDDSVLKGIYIINKEFHIKNKFLDSKELIALLNPSLEDYTLKGLKRYIKIKNGYYNKPMEYENLTLELVNKFLSDFWMENPLIIPREFDNLRTWPWYSYIQPKSITMDNKDFYKEEKFKEDHIKVNYKKYEELFNDEGLWKRYHSNYRVRENQVKLSMHIKEGILKKNITLVEAPTGIGKSMAYLLPSSIFCHFNKDKKMFISTNTKGLQKQLVTKDIPNLLKILKLNNVKYVLIKGKSNYFCIDRFNYLEEDLIRNNPLAYVYIYRYINDYGLGDIEEVNPYIREKFNLEKLIPHCFCDSELCNIEECAYDERCYYAKKVRSLEEGNIIVINHSLLLRWPYENYAKIQHLIMDEAHNLSMEAYDAYEEEVNTLDIYKALMDIYNKESNKGFLLYLSHKSQGAFDLNNIYNYIVSLSYNIEAVKSSIIKYADDKKITNEYDLNEKFNLEDGVLKGVKANLNRLGNNMYNFLEEINKGLSNIENKENFKNDIRVKILKERCKFLNNIKDNIEKFILNQEEGYCYSFQLHKGYKWWSLKITPLDISGFFHKKVISDLESGLFISATLSTEGKYNDLKRTLGINLCEKSQENRKDVIDINPIESSFHYEKRSVVYAPKFYSAINENVEEYSLELLDKFKEILKIIEGNVLMLFTNIRRLKEFKKLIKEEEENLRIKIITDKNEINNLKKRDNTYVFLGSKGMFEGIDIPGDSMNTVILDKIPNINSNDPFYEALIEKNMRGKEDYWRCYNKINYPIVSIATKQIFGRLIRTEYDYGSLFIMGKFYEENQNTRKLQEELHRSPVIRGDIEDIKKDLEKRTRYWIKLNLLKILKEEAFKELKYINIIEKKEEVLNLKLKNELRKNKLNDNIYLKIYPNIFLKTKDRIIKFNKKEQDYIYKILT